MLKSNKQKIICFFFASVFLFSAAFILNSTGYLSNESDGNFDWWSESLIYADVMYNKDYPDESKIFDKGLSPSKLAETYGGEWNDYENQVRLAYQDSDNHYNKSDYGDYTSNIVIQRFFFRFLDNVLPISNTLKIHLFHFLNCLLLGVPLSVILCWIIKVLKSYKIGIGLLVTLSLFAPNLIMYGKNLYWCAWTLFFPTIVMIVLIESKWFQNAKYKLILLSVFAVFGITIKCLFYFEFISVVMVSMMIPVIYYLFAISSNKYSLKKKLTYFVVVSLSAVIGFLIVIIVKYLLLYSFYGNASEALNTLFGNLQDRLLGNTNADSNAIVESANASFFVVLKTMLQKPFVGIKSVLSITQLGLILSALVSTICLFKLNKQFNILSKAEKSWIVCNWISIIAPVSWFVMAKPHTYIHNHHCSIAWFILFDILALSIVFMLINKTIQLLKEKANQ